MHLEIQSQVGKEAVEKQLVPKVHQDKRFSQAQLSSAFKAPQSRLHMQKLNFCCENNTQTHPIKEHFWDAEFK